MTCQGMVGVHQVLHIGQNCFRDLQDVKICLWRGNNKQTLRVQDMRLPVKCTESSVN